MRPSGGGVKTYKKRSLKIYFKEADINEELIDKMAQLLRKCCSFG